MLLKDIVGYGLKESREVPPWKSLVTLATAVSMESWDGNYITVSWKVKGNQFWPWDGSLCWFNATTETIMRTKCTIYKM